MVPTRSQHASEITFYLDLGEGTIHCFHESRALNGYLKGGYYI
jgi:hypothetical protein